MENFVQVEVKLEIDEEADINVDDLGVKEEPEDEVHDHIVIKSEEIEFEEQAVPSTPPPDPPADLGTVVVPSSGSKKIFSCEYCGKGFSVKCNLKSHILTVHDGIAKFKCDKCDYNATQKISLVRHQKSMHGGSLYPCSYCKDAGVIKNFKWEVDLKRHIESRHSNTKFMCDVCHNEFNTKRYLNNHKRLVHLGRVFKCDKCDVTVTTKASLQMHIDAVHLNTKYKCETCEFQASWKNDLMRHMKEVHLGTRFKCLKCNYETSRNYLLKKHVKAKHPDEIISTPMVEKVSPELNSGGKFYEVKLEVLPGDVKMENF